MKFELSNHVALQHLDWRSSEFYYKDFMVLDTKIE